MYTESYRHWSTDRCRWRVNEQESMQLTVHSCKHMVQFCRVININRQQVVYLPAGAWKQYNAISSRFAAQTYVVDGTLVTLLDAAWFHAWYPTPILFANFTPQPHRLLRQRWVICISCLVNFVLFLCMQYANHLYMSLFLIFTMGMLVKFFITFRTYREADAVLTIHDTIQDAILMCAQKLT